MRKPITTTLVLVGVALLNAACPGDQQPATTDDPFVTDPAVPPPTQPAPPPVMPADTPMVNDTPGAPGAPGATPGTP